MIRATGKLAGLGATVAAAALGSPALAATHRIVLAQGIEKVWVATKGGAIECGRSSSPRQMTDCKKFHPVGQSGLVDMVGNLVYVVRTTNAEYRSDEYYVDPVHDVLPKGEPIRLSVPK